MNGLGRLHDYCPLCHRLIVAREGGAVDESEAEQGSIRDEDLLMPPTRFPALIDGCRDGYGSY